MVMGNIADKPTSDAFGMLSAEQLDNMIDRFPWFTAARVARARRTGVSDPALALQQSARPLPIYELSGTDGIRKRPSAAEDAIERFLNGEPRRIVPALHSPSDTRDLSAASVAEDPDLVSEELAEIYARQRLNEKAKAIYAKISLLYPEKRVYFAEIIAGLDTLETKGDRRE